MLSAISPFDHACDLSDLDYSRVEDGLITCTTCPRRFVLVPSWQPGVQVWKNSCECRMPQAHGRDYWTKDLKPYPKPTAEEIIANRQARLEMLDQKAAEQRRLFQDSIAGLDWLKKERGAGGKVDSEWWSEVLANPPAEAVVALSEPFRGTVRLTLRFPSLESCRAFLNRMTK